MNWGPAKRGVPPPGYPAAYERWLSLRDGRAVWLRPILPSDAPELAEAIRTADPDTLRRRFLGAAPRLTPALLTWLTTVDYVRRFALVAFDPATGRGVAIARFEPLDEDGAAEVAVAVDPAWRRVGLATRLVELLAEAALARGIHSFGASYLADNRPIKAMLAHTGAKQLIAHGVTELELALGDERDTRDGDAGSPPDRPSDNATGTRRRAERAKSGKHRRKGSQRKPGTPEGSASPAPEHDVGTTSRDRDRSHAFRTDVQALRAVAVLAVLFNHLWPGRLTGGYVGVDVFFVISGFLISSLLCREIAGTGRVRLGRFYARRIRRLLPAAFLVLGFSVVAAYLLLPYPRWAETAKHAIASALYAENWLLTAESVNYSAADAAASLEQHYWSLSVEEQFYLVWPLLLLLLFKIRRRRAQFAGVAVIAAASFAFCLYYTRHAPSQAYFVTQTRAWEFAIGALVAVAGARLVLPARAAGLASFAGLAMIVGSAFGYDHTTPFPGYLALVPTIGTALVIVAGNRDGRQWHTALSAARPVQWVGDVSYSLYLWHWPLILLAPFALGEVLTLPYRLAVLAASFVLAFGTKVLVEDRGMSWRPLARSTRLTLAAMVAGLVVVTVAASGLHQAYDRQVAQTARDMSGQPARPCDGAQAMVPANGCVDPFGPARVVAMGPANEYFRVPPACVQLDDNKFGETRTTTVCDFSQGVPAAEVVWLVGDSHALQWQGPLVELARERKWLLKLAVIGGCPFAKVDFTGYRAPAPEEFREACTDWSTRVTDVVAADRPSKVFVSFFARMEFADDGSGRSQIEQYRDGLEPYWRTWTGVGARVVVLADPPLNGDVRPADCVALRPDDPRACAVDRTVAQPPDPLAEAARSSRDPAVSLVDLTDYFCDARRCYAVVGNVAVYYDGNHMNIEFARSLAPMLGDALDGTHQ